MAFRCSLRRRNGSLLPASYTKAKGPPTDGATGFAEDWPQRTDAPLVEHRPDLCKALKSLRPLRLPLDPKAAEYSPSQSTIEKTKAAKGRFASLPFSNGAAFKSNDGRDARVLGKVKVATRRNSKPSRGQPSSTELETQLRSELAELRSDVGHVLQQVSLLLLT